MLVVAFIMWVGKVRKSGPKHRYYAGRQSEKGGAEKEEKSKHVNDKKSGQRQELLRQIYP